MITIIAIVAVLLIIVTASQMLRVAELKSLSKGEKIYNVTEKQSKIQSYLLLIFPIVYFAFFAWLVIAYSGDMLPEPASVHGVGIDKLMDVTLWFIIPVFVITHIFLFYFAFKYSYSSNRKATFFSHDNKLETFWTVIPSVALTVLILYGLSNWNKIMKPIPADVEHITIEICGQQFMWGARYAGKDGKLGRAGVEYIGGLNSLGIDSSDVNAADDKIVKGEFHLPLNEPVQFFFRSKDVIHSAYMPHFRAQMNCVPGMKTQFNFIPTITTEEMRKKTHNKNFDYILLCNKICGAGHFNMQMKIVVESKKDYEKWLSEQKTFLQ